MNCAPLGGQLYTFQFGQLPGHPIQIMGTIDDSANSSLSGTVSFTVHKYGDLSFTGAECENAGPEFNPLEDPHNPTDSSAATVRGGIDDVTASTDSDD